MIADQHASLTPVRWAAFTLDQQILMIANEMNRASGLFSPADRARLRTGYERVLRLTDLTVAVHAVATLRRELLRWRDLIAVQYVADEPSPAEHRDAYRCLLLFTPTAATQRAFMNDPTTANR